MSDPKIGQLGSMVRNFIREFDVHTIFHRNGVLMCTMLLLIKISMKGVHLKLVKEIPRKFQNSDFICGSLFGILISVRLQSIHGNQQYG